MTSRDKRWDDGDKLLDREDHILLGIVVVVFIAVGSAILYCSTLGLI